jgi:ribose transport system ATP-binding protein
LEEAIIELMLGAKVERQRVAARDAGEAPAPAAQGTLCLVRRNLRVGAKLPDMTFMLRNDEVAGVVVELDELLAALAARSVRPPARSR